jgi:hypothetical protein
VPGVRRKRDAEAGSLLLVDSQAYVHAQKRTRSVSQAATPRKPGGRTAASETAE